MGDGFRRGRLADGDEVAERRHAPGSRSDVVLLDVRRVRSKLLIGLHVNAVRAVVEIEVVDVGGPEQDLHGVRDVRHRDAQALGLLAVDVHDELRIVRRELREEPGQPGRLVALGDQLVGRGLQPLDLPAALVEQLVRKATELPQALNRRRQKRDDHRARDLAEGAEELSDEDLRGMLVALAILEVFQLREHDALVRRGPGESETAGRKDLLASPASSSCSVRSAARCPSCSRARRPMAPERGP